MKKHYTNEVLFETYPATGFNAEPVLLMHEDDLVFQAFIDRIKKERPEYEFSTTDKKLHRLWIVQDVRR